MAQDLLTGVDRARRDDARLVAQVHPDEERDTTVQAIVRALLDGSRPAQVAAEHLLCAQALPSPEGALRRETLAIHTSTGSPDGREGVDAFIRQAGAPLSQRPGLTRQVNRLTVDG